MGAIDAALSEVEDVASEGELGVGTLADLDVAGLADPIELPDGRIIYPPVFDGKQIHEIAEALLDFENPSESRFLRLTGPPGTGKSQLGRLIGYHLWKVRGREVEERNGQPFYGYEEMSPGPSSDEFTFRYEYVPQDDGGVKLVESAFVRAMREGTTVMIDEVNTARESALLSINSTLDGRLTLYLPTSGETVKAAPGFNVLLAYNPGLVNATDLPTAWFSRFPAPLEIISNWAALIPMGVDKKLVNAAAKLDMERRTDGLSWSPQFREIESLHRMLQNPNLTTRLAIGLFMSNVDEQLASGIIGVPEAEAVVRMFDSAGFDEFKIPSGSRERVPTVGGYMKAASS